MPSPAVSAASTPGSSRSSTPTIVAEVQQYKPKNPTPLSTAPITAPSRVDLDTDKMIDETAPKVAALAVKPRDSMALKSMESIEDMIANFNLSMKAQEEIVVAAKGSPARLPSMVQPPARTQASRETAQLAPRTSASRSVEQPFADKGIYYVDGIPTYPVTPVTGTAAPAEANGSPLVRVESTKSSTTYATRKVGSNP
jgi:hypothetical protein